LCLLLTHHEQQVRFDVPQTMSEHLPNDHYLSIDQHFVMIFQQRHPVAVTKEVTVNAGVLSFPVSKIPL
jgi:hypothetical protein